MTTPHLTSDELDRLRKYPVIDNETLGRIVVVHKVDLDALLDELAALREENKMLRNPSVREGIAELAEEFASTLLRANAARDEANETLARQRENYLTQALIADKASAARDQLRSEAAALREQNEKARALLKEAEETLEKIADPRKRHSEPDKYTELGCVMNIADEALQKLRAAREGGA